MTEHMHKELTRLEQRLLSLSALVQENIQKSVRAFENHDPPLAKEVIEGDNEVDQIEVGIEEDCLKMLALYQPVAIDLRYIVAALKINNDLERVGDLAANIADSAIVISDHPGIEFPFDFNEYAERTLDMLRRAINAFIHFDLEEAGIINKLDDEIDEKNRQAQETVSKVICHDPDHDVAYLHILRVSRCLERVGDHATNIAEDIIYLLQGEIIRHKRSSLSIEKK